MAEEYNENGHEVIDFGPITDEAKAMADQMLTCISDCFIEIKEQHDPENLRNYLAVSLQGYEKDKRLTLVEMNKNRRAREGDPHDS